MTFRKLCSALWAAVLVAAAQAHEPYLLLTANAEGEFLAEAGYSDMASVEGLKLLVRNRDTGETLSEHTLPENGMIVLPIPAVPYRVTFDGGPGHRISKPGPEAPKPAATAAVAAAPELREQTKETPAAAASAPAAPETAVAQVATVPSSSSAVSGADETVRIALVVGIFFLFGAIAFALGYGAGRRGA